MDSTEPPDSGFAEILQLATNFTSRWAPAAILSVTRATNHLTTSQISIYECTPSQVNCTNSYNLSTVVNDEVGGDSNSNSSSNEIILLDVSELQLTTSTSGDNITLLPSSSINVTEFVVTPDLTIHYPVLAVLLAVMCLLVIFGNALVMVAIKRERHLQTVTNYFVCSLAAADLLVGALVMPFSVVHEVLNKWWLFGQDWCDLWHSFDVLASTASILNLCVISLDRYWAITDPMSYPTKMTSKKAMILIAVVWTCSSLISFPAIIWWRATSTATVEEAAYRCLFTNDLGYLLVSSTISFYCPLAVMLFVYYRIYKAAVEQTRSIQLGSKCVQSTTEEAKVVLRIHRGGGGGLNLNTNHDCDSNDHDSDRSKATNWSMGRKLAKLTKETKAAKTLGIVMGVFILCWLPFFATNVLVGLWPTAIDDPDLVGSIVTWLGWLNSGMNPVIYACWSRDFRRAFEKILCGQCCRRRRERKSRALAFARFAANDRGPGVSALDRSSNSSSGRGHSRGNHVPAHATNSLPMSTMRDPIAAVTHASISAVVEVVQY